MTIKMVRGWKVDGQQSEDLFESPCIGIHGELDDLTTF